MEESKFKIIHEYPNVTKEENEENLNMALLQLHTIISKTLTHK